MEFKTSFIESIHEKMNWELSRDDQLAVTFQVEHILVTGEAIPPTPQSANLRKLNYRFDVKVRFCLNICFFYNC